MFTTRALLLSRFVRSMFTFVVVVGVACVDEAGTSHFSDIKADQSQWSNCSIVGKSRVIVLTPWACDNLFSKAFEGF